MIERSDNIVLICFSLANILIVALSSGCRKVFLSGELDQNKHDLFVPWLLWPLHCPFRAMLRLSNFKYWKLQVIALYSFCLRNLSQIVKCVKQGSWLKLIAQLVFVKAEIHGFREISFVNKSNTWASLMTKLDHFSYKNLGFQPYFGLLNFLKLSFPILTLFDGKINIKVKTWKPGI